jgi:polygalacturonase
MINPASWMLVFGACDGVTVRGIQQIGEISTSDGIDIVGSSDVLIEDSFFRNNDDCIVLKARDLRDEPPDATLDWRRDIRNVLVQRCVLLNDYCGNALEIGYETSTEAFRNITFRDCDIIAAHGEGAVFSIHAGDRATISDVLYEDIRVEHFYSKLIDLRIFSFRKVVDAERGQIRRVTLRRIETVFDNYNTVSLIGGHDAAHTVEDVRIEDFVMGGKKITNADELHLFVKQARGIAIL